MKLIITHDSADFDAIASSLLLAKIFHGYVLKPQSFEEPVLNFLKQNKIVPFITEEEIEPQNIDTVIFSDRGKDNTLLKKLGLNSKKIVVYDHHENSLFGSNTSLIYYKFGNKLKKLTANEAL